MRAQSRNAMEVAGVVRLTVTLKGLTFRAYPSQSGLGRTDHSVAVAVEGALRRERLPQGAAGGFGLGGLERAAADPRRLCGREPLEFMDDEPRLAILGRRRSLGRVHLIGDGLAVTESAQVRTWGRPSKAGRPLAILERASW